MLANRTRVFLRLCLLVRPVVACLVLAAACALLAGCPGDTDGGPIIDVWTLPDAAVSLDLPVSKRQCLLGITPMGAPNPETTQADLLAAVRLAGGLAELIVIRQRVDWEAYRPGGNAPASLTDDLLNLLEMARSAGMTKCLVELDPVVSRHEIGPLPPVLEGHDFSSPDVRHALLKMAEQVALRGQPDYLSFAVEINGYYESHPEDFENFVTLHKELYDVVKRISPKTQIMASFNLEAIQGLLKGVTEYGNHGPQWFLIDRFEPKIDAVAFSTLPYSVYYSPLLLPDDYLSRIANHTSRPFVLSEVGWTTSQDVSSDELKQAQYLSLMTRQALPIPQLQVFAWTIMTDPPPGTLFDEFPTFMYLGLFDVNGEPKTALDVWTQFLEMPVETP